MLQTKPYQALKRPPPMCTKYCAKCDKTVHAIQTACKKCIICETPYEKVGKKTTHTHATVIATLVLMIIIFKVTHKEKKLEHNYLNTKSIPIISL